MDAETLKQLGIENEEVIAKVVAAHQAGLSAEVDGLKNKNQELLGKIAAGKGVDPKEFERLKQIEKDFQNSQTKAQEEAGEYKKLYESLKTDHDKLVTDRDTSLAEKDQTIKNLRKEMQIGDALGAYDVIPGMREIAVNTILPKVALNDDGKAMVGSKKVSDFVKEWIEGDVGKNFLKNDRTGGGAGGNEGGGINAEQLGWFKKGSPTWNATKQGELRKSDPALAERLEKAANAS